MLEGIRLLAGKTGVLSFPVGENQQGQRFSQSFSLQHKILKPVWQREKTVRGTVWLDHLRSGSALCGLAL